ncbi:uncharacterized protein BKA78DRAFT_113348 [Phyllosticta capitalensis]|uniref:uncharacterized protein n=1 Tax=Phyllosticta capitalensis TaxID=121624 RepID=UPI00312F1E10
MGTRRRVRYQREGGPPVSFLVCTLDSIGPSSPDLPFQNDAGQVERELVLRVRGATCFMSAGRSMLFLSLRADNCIAGLINRPNPRCEKMSGMQRLRSSIQFDSVYPTRISNQREIQRAPSSKNARLPNRQTTSPTDFTRLGLSPDGDGGRFWVGCTADSGRVASLFSRRCARTCGLIVCTVRPRDRSSIKSSAVRPSVYRRQRESLVPQPKAPLCRALRFVCGYAFCCPLAENSLPSRLGSGVNLARTAPKKVKQACL